MKSDGFTGHCARAVHGGAMHGLRYVAAPVYDRILGKPHPTVFHRDDGRYALGIFGPDNSVAITSRWHAHPAMAFAAARRVSVKADRRQRRGRVAKKLAARGGRRRFAAPAFVRRMNRGAA